MVLLVRLWWNFVRWLISHSGKRSWRNELESHRSSWDSIFDFWKWKILTMVLLVRLWWNFVRWLISHSGKRSWRNELESHRSSWDSIFDFLNFWNDYLGIYLWFESLNGRDLSILETGIILKERRPSSWKKEGHHLERKKSIILKERRREFREGSPVTAIYPAETT